MSRISLPLLLGLLVAGCARALAQVSLGARAGVTFSRGAYDDDDLDELAYATAGYAVGVPVAVELSENLGLQAELNLLQRGQRTEIELFGLTSETITRLTYLDLNALAKAGLLTDALTAVAVAGPSLAYALGGRVIDGDDTAGIDWGDDGNTLRRLDVGLVLGGQAGLGVGPGQVTLDARYRLGISDLTDDGDGAAVTLHSRAFSAALGYLGPLR